MEDIARGESNAGFNVTWLNATAPRTMSLKASPCTPMHIILISRWQPLFCPLPISDVQALLRYAPLVRVTQPYRQHRARDPAETRRRQRPGRTRCRRHLRGAGEPQPGRVAQVAYRHQVARGRRARDVDSLWSHFLPRTAAKPRIKSGAGFAGKCSNSVSTTVAVRAIARQFVRDQAASCTRRCCCGAHFVTLSR